MIKQSIYILILNYNGKEDTLKCLASLQKVRSPKDIRVHLLVIDNNSQDDSLAVIREQFPKVEILENPINLGFAAGNNRGITYALNHDADYVIIINNDTIIDPNFVNELLKATRQHPQGGMFGPKIYFAPGYEFHKDRYKKSDQGKVIWSAGGDIDWDNIYGINIGIDEVDHGQFDEETRVEKLSGCCVLLTRQLLEKIGGFDERYFMYHEDDDLAMRVKQAGYELWYVPSAKIWHLNAGSSGAGSELHDYFLTRNRLLFGLTYAPWRTRIALVRESCKLLISGRPWQRRGVVDFYLQKFGNGSFQPE